MADKQLTKAIIDRLKQGETEMAWVLFREAMQTFSVENKQLLIDQVLAVTAIPAESPIVQSSDVVVPSAGSPVTGSTR